MSRPAGEPDPVRNRAAAQTDWLARLAHDLRGPITPMRYAVQMLQSGRLPAGRAPELLQTLDRQLDLLLQVNDELGDMLKIAGNQYALQLQDYDLRGILEAAVRRAARQAGKTGANPVPVPIRGDAPIRVVADESRLAQLLAHLIGSIGMCGSDTGRWWIEVQRRDDRALVRLCDGESPLPVHAGIDYLVTGDPPPDPGVLGMSAIIGREIAVRHGAGISVGQAGKDGVGWVQLSLPVAAR